MEKLNWIPDEIAKSLTETRNFETVFESGEDISVELYAPVGEDTQTPHDRDELYIIISGRGRFRRGDETVDFAPGDLLFVPAHVPHRFETFSEDFKTWVVFFGPEKSA